jgi:hypothetical protein
MGLGSLIRIALVLLGAINVVLGLTVMDNTGTVIVGAVILLVGLLWMRAAQKRSGAKG